MDRENQNELSQWSARFSVGLLVLALVVSSFGIWILSGDARKEINAMATANADSTQWSLAQLEVEFLRFNNALAAVDETSPETLRVARRRFDVFFSRVQIIATSGNFASVRVRQDVQAALGIVNNYLSNTAKLIDASDRELIASFDQLKPVTDGLIDHIRVISLAGVAVFSDRADTQRSRVAGALFDLSSLALVLFGGLMLLVLALSRSINLNRKRSELAMLAESRLRAIVSTSLDGILVVGRDGKIIDFNGAAAKIFGYQKSEAIGHSMADLIIPDHFREAHEAGMAHHIKTGEKRVIDKGLIQLEAKDSSGRIFPVELSISTAQSKDGNIFVSYIRDISSRVEAETELVLARDKALASEKAKAEFLAIMSHEMRTPLNGILGTLQLLDDTPLTEKQRELARIMETSGKILLHNVNNVLDISQADAGMTVANLNSFDVLDLVNEAADGQHAFSQSRGNTLVTREVGPPIGPVLGDKNRIRQILLNLIGNAIKFTRDGAITVEIERDPDGVTVEFRVSDTGIGIAPSQINKVFEDFVTLDPTYTREVEGTGLGLGIVKRLVNMMHGEIGIESEPRQGSVFWVRLPLPSNHDLREHSEPLELSETKQRIDKPLSVLLVEDNEINRLVAREMISGLGCKTVEANDGHEGVLQANAKRFDLILMDISMPRLDGVAASTAIREGGGPNSGTPIFALTAHAMPDDIKRFHDAGMNEVIVKPIDRQRLKTVLQDLSTKVKTEPDARFSIKSPVDRTSAELVDILGTDVAENLINQAVTQIGEGISECLQYLEDPAEKSQVLAKIHSCSGFAAVVGLANIREHLATAEFHLQKDRIDAAQNSLVSALEALK
jgi:PAS domain S-box-containing protein